MISYVYLRIPKKYERTFEGVLYRLGEENKDFVKEVTIKFNGEMSRDKWLNRWFKGNIDFSDYENIIKNRNNIKYIEQCSDIELQFDKNNNAYFIYYVWQPLSIESIGTIYFNEKYTQFTLTVFESTGKNSARWNGKDGLMISAPADNREEALKLSNILMKEHRIFNGRLNPLE